jgi:enoyl-CoA hydratase/carnithine racemase
MGLGMADEVVEPDAVVSRAVEVASGLARSVPADTYAYTKAQLRRSTLERIVNYQADEYPHALELWVRRTQDGWMAGYLDRATGKK